MKRLITIILTTLLVFNSSLTINVTRADEFEEQNSVEEVLQEEEKEVEEELPSDEPESEVSEEQEESVEENPAEEEITAEEEPEEEKGYIIPELTFVEEELDNSNLLHDEVPEYRKSLMADNLPSSFQLGSDALTDIRNQGSYGTCWAFSTIASVESTWKNDEGEDLDLSELHLAHFAFNSNGIADPLGLITNDGGNPGTPKYGTGGNYYIAMYTLASGVGLVDESDLPYSNIGSNIDSSLCYESDYLVNEVKLYNSSERNEIKKAVMNDGAVGISMFYDDSYLNNGSYYYSGGTGTNHAVTIVGWDDNYSKDNFNSFGLKPENNGAWLVRNSWGTLFANDGYFWLSYYDSAIASVTAAQFGICRNVYDYIYQYDGSAGTNCIFSYPTDTLCTGNIYRSQQDETLTAIGYFTFETNINYEIKVYKKSSAMSNPEDGTLVSSATVTGSESDVGFHTVELSQDVSLSKDEYFSVVVTYSKSSSDIECRFDISDDFVKGSSFTNTSKTGESFVRASSSGSWTDCYNIGTNANEETVHATARIKAYTVVENNEDVFATAGEVIESGIIGYNANYSLYENGTVIINGSGEIYSTSNNEHLIANYRAVKAIVFEEGITSIPSSAFRDYPSLEAIKFSSTVTDISESAFGKCPLINTIEVSEQNTIYSSPNKCNAVIRNSDKKLIIGSNNTTIPNDTAIIGSYSFSSRSGLTSITIPASVTEIESSAFGSCVGLKSIVIPDTVTELGSSAFAGCSNLESIHLSDALTTLNFGLFDKCYALTDVNIPASCKSIVDGVFATCSSLSEIVLPEGLESIGWVSFGLCTSLQSVVLPSTLISLDSMSFTSCSNLSRIYIPASVTTINSDSDYMPTFKGCSSLTIYMESTSVPSGWNANWNKLNDTETIPYVTGYSLAKFMGNDWDDVDITGNNVVIPDGITAIPDNAFANRTTLESITIPASVKSIGNNAFYNCTSLNSVTIAEGLETIGNRAFEECTSLERIKLPTTVESIGNNAFKNMTNLKAIFIPSGSTINPSSAEQSPFFGCRDDKGIIYTDATNEGEENWAFNWSAIETSPDSSRHGTYVHYNTPYNDFEYWAEIKDNTEEKIVVRSDIEDIPSGAFRFNKNVKEVVLPSGLKTIGAEAFVFCERLTRLIIPSGVTTIDAWAFEFCSSLREIYIPSTVTVFGGTFGNGYVFEGCSKELIIYCSTACNGSSWGAHWNYRDSDTKLTVKTYDEKPYGLVFEYDSNKGGFVVKTYSGTYSNVVIPSSYAGLPVTGIKTGAFAGNSYLRWVTIPEYIKYIEAGAFNNTNNLTTVNYKNEKTEWDLIDIGDRNTVFSEVDINFTNGQYDKDSKLTLYQDYNNALIIEGDKEILEKIADYTVNNNTNGTYTRGGCIHIDGYAYIGNSRKIYNSTGTVETKEYEYIDYDEDKNVLIVSGDLILASHVVSGDVSFTIVPSDNSYYYNFSFKISGAKKIEKQPEITVLENGDIKIKADPEYLEYLMNSNDASLDVSRHATIEFDYCGNDFDCAGDYGYIEDRNEKETFILSDDGTYIIYPNSMQLNAYNGAIINGENDVVLYAYGYEPSEPVRLNLSHNYIPAPEDATAVYNTETYCIEVTSSNKEWLGQLDGVSLIDERGSVRTIRGIYTEIIGNTCSIPIVYYNIVPDGTYDVVAFCGGRVWRDNEAEYSLSLCNKLVISDLELKDVPHANGTSCNVSFDANGLVIESSNEDFLNKLVRVSNGTKTDEQIIEYSNSNYLSLLKDGYIILTDYSTQDQIVLRNTEDSSIIIKSGNKVTVSYESLQAAGIRIFKNHRYSIFMGAFGFYKTGDYAYSEYGATIAKVPTDVKITEDTAGNLIIRTSNNDYLNNIRCISISDDEQYCNVFKDEMTVTSGKAVIDSDLITLGSKTYDIVIESYGYEYYSKNNAITLKKHSLKAVPDFSVSVISGDMYIYSEDTDWIDGLADNENSGYTRMLAVRTLKSPNRYVIQSNDKYCISSGLKKFDSNTIVFSIQNQKSNSIVSGEYTLKFRVNGYEISDETTVTFTNSLNNTPSDLRVERNGSHLYVYTSDSNFINSVDTTTSSNWLYENPYGYSSDYISNSYVLYWPIIIGSNGGGYGSTAGMWSNNIPVTKDTENGYIDFDLSNTEMNLDGDEKHVLSIRLNGYSSITVPVDCEIYSVNYHNDLGYTEYRMDYPHYYAQGLDKYSYNLKNPEAEGYQFGGWYSDENYRNKITSINFANQTGDIDLYAKFTPINYTITYMLGGGTNNSANPSRYTTEDTVILEEPARKGYEFLGWFTSADFAEENRIETISEGSIGNYTLYAKWELAEYAITLNAYGGEPVSATGIVSDEDEDGVYEGTYNIESSFTLPTFTKDGYRFDGWYKDLDNSKSKVTKVAKGTTGELELYAKFTPIDYTVKYSTNSGTITKGTVYTTKYNVETDEFYLPENESMTRKGYEFSGWYLSYDSKKKEFDNEVTDLETLKEANLEVNDVEYKNITLYASWTPITYYVNFTYDESLDDVIGEMDSLEVFYDETKELTSNRFSRPGYAFNGWKADNGKSYSDMAKVKNLKTEEGDEITFTANWKKVSSYTIKYNLNGGSITKGVKYPTSYRYDPDGDYYDDPTLLLPDYDQVTRKGYSFVGWYTTKDFELDTDITEINVDTMYENLNLYACWDPNRYPITFYIDGVSVNDDVYEYSSNSKDKYVLETESYEIFGYTFKWYSDEKCTKAITSIARNTIPKTEEGISVYGKYTPNTYKITYKLGKGETNGTKNPTSYKYSEENIISLNNPTKKGIVFEGWYYIDEYGDTQYLEKDEATGKYYFSASLGENITLYSLFGTDYEEYTITYINEDGEYVENEEHYTYNTPTFKLNNPTRHGYSFTGWYNTETNKKVTQISKGSMGSMTLEARYTPNTYKITYKLGKGETNGSKNPTSYKYSEENIISLNNPTKKGIIFEGWYYIDEYGDTQYLEKDEATGKYYFGASLGENITLYSLFGTDYEEYTITYLNENDEIVHIEGNPESYYYTSSTFKLINLEKTGYTFSGWYNTETNKKVTQISKGSMGSMTLEARYTPNTYTVTFNKNGATSGSMKTVSAKYDVEFTLEANKFKRTGYTFEGWQYLNDDGEECFADDCETLINITEKKSGKVTFNAVWQPISYRVNFVIDEDNVNGDDAENNESEYYLEYEDGYYSHLYYGEEQKLSPTMFTKHRATISGWYYYNSSNKKVTLKADASLKNLTTVDDEIIELYPIWAEGKYSVRYDANGGTGTMASTLAQEGKPFNLTANAYKKTGYAFAGWSMNQNDEVVYQNKEKITDTLTDDSSVTLYAVWQPITYKLVFNKNGGTGTVANVVVEYDEAYTVTKNYLKKNNRAFIGWAKKSSATVPDYEIGDEIVNLANANGKSVTLYAVYGKEPIEYNVGVCIYQLADNFMYSYKEEITEYFEAKSKGEIKYNVEIVDGKNDAATQTEQINTFIAKGVDALIVNMVQPSTIEVVEEAAEEAGIPVVFINREPAEAEAHQYGANQCYVGVKAYDAGTAQGKIVYDLPNHGDLNGNGKVDYVMIMGDVNNTDAQYRTEYSIKYLTDNGVEVNKLLEQTGNWDQAQGQEIAANALSNFGAEIDVIFCNNDGMALGAYQSIVAAGRTINEDIYLVGIDAMDECVEMVNNGTMTGTVSNDVTSQADAACEAVLGYLNGRTVETYQYVPYVAVKTARNEHNISYVLNGGTNSSENSEKIDQYELYYLADPVKDGYIFDGWYYDSSFTSPVMSIGPNDTKNITVYAKWLKGADTFNYVYASDLSTFDYICNNKTSNGDIYNNGVEGLLTQDSYGNLVAGMAESWEANEDATEWTFHIRNDAYWVKSDGTSYRKVTAQDFVTGLRHAAEFDSNTLWLVGDVIVGLNEYVNDADWSDEAWSNVGIEVDGNKVIYKMTGSTPYFPSMTTYSIMFPVNKAFLESKGTGCKLGSPNEDSCAFGSLNKDGILYNSAYRISSYTNKGNIVLTKNTKYWDAENVFLNSIKLTYTADNDDPDYQYKMFKNGEIDMASVRVTNQAIKADAEENYSNNMYTTDTGSTLYWVSLNVNRQAYSCPTDPSKAVSPKTDTEKADTKTALLNVNFRRAVMAAFSSRAYETVTLDEDYADGPIRNTIVAPTYVRINGEIYGDVLEDKLQNYSGYERINLNDGQDAYYNVEKAQAWLAKAKEELGDSVSWPIKLDTLCVETSETSTNRALAEKAAIEAALGTENVVVNIISCDSDTYYNCWYYTENGRDVNADLLLFNGWGPDYEDPSSYLDTFLPGTGQCITSFGFSSDSRSTVDEQDLKEEIGFDVFGEMCAEADAIVDDNDARFTKYAEAEAYFLQLALVRPFTTSGASVQISRIVPYTACYGNYGWASYNNVPIFKGMKVYANKVQTTAEHQQAKAKWLAGN